MTNNDILRRIRYMFDYSDPKMVTLFEQGGETVTRQQLDYWLLKEGDLDYRNCSDAKLAYFLTGLIIEKRGKKDGPQPEPEKRLTNNIILRKLKIAFNLKSDDMLELIDSAGLKMSEHELSAFFRKPGHQHYRTCKDQVLRNLLKGLQLKYRPNTPPKEAFKWT